MAFVFRFGAFVGLELKFLLPFQLLHLKLLFLYFLFAEDPLADYFRAVYHVFFATLDGILEARGLGEHHERIRLFFFDDFNEFHLPKLLEIVCQFL